MAWGPLTAIWVAVTVGLVGGLLYLVAIGDDEAWLGLVAGGAVAIAALTLALGARSHAGTTWGRRARRAALPLAMGLALLAVFAALALSFQANPGFGPCPRPPPCDGQTACVIPSCPTSWAFAFTLSFVAGPALLAAAAVVAYGGREHPAGARPTAA